MFGELDYRNGLGLTERVHAILGGQPNRLTLDLSRVSLFASGSVSALVAVHLTCSAACATPTVTHPQAKLDSGSRTASTLQRPSPAERHGDGQRGQFRPGHPANAVHGRRTTTGSEVSAAGWCRRAYSMVSQPCARPATAACWASRVWS